MSVGDAGISLVEHLQLLSVSEHPGDGDGQESLAAAVHGVAKSHT